MCISLNWFGVNKFSVGPVSKVFFQFFSMRREHKPSHVHLKKKLRSQRHFFLEHSNFLVRSLRNFSERRWCRHGCFHATAVECCQRNKDTLKNIIDNKIKR